MPETALPPLGFQNACFHAGRNTSVRRGTRWHGVPAATVCLPGGHTCALALATQLRVFAALTAADLADEHDPRCRTPAGLLAVLQQIYPGFCPEETVTLVHFWLP